MKGLHHLALGTAMAALCSAADAQPSGVGGGFRHSPPPAANLPVQGFFPGLYVYDREVVHVIEREVVHVDPVPPPEPPPPPRKPYKLGSSYDSLPPGCMKMIERGTSYYLCSGEWYRQVGSGSGVSYRAVKSP